MWQGELGVKKALDIKAFHERYHYYEGSNENLDTGWIQDYWSALYEDVNTALEKADQALSESELDEFRSLGYRSKYDEIWNEFDRMNKLAKYVVDLEEELYNDVDARFSKALIEEGTGGLCLLSEIRIDEICIANNGTIETSMENAASGNTANSNTIYSTNLTLGFDDFIGYQSKYDKGNCFVFGFTDVLYAPNLQGD